ncbi:MAG: DUF3108 domain-containing protein [Caldilineae bacterium]|nr:MAG: DUF3108 domain-containing protein [Caldilineae bacterium]
MKIRLILAFLGFLLPASAWASCMPFGGERMSFSVGWEFINAGTATMTIDATDDGWSVNTFARTNRFLDLFKKVRDSIVARGVCTSHGMQSTVFDLEQHERKYHAKKQTRFLWQKGLVTFTQNGKTDAYNVPSGHLSVMDAFLKTRAMPLRPGTQISIPVFDSRKKYLVVVNVGQHRKKLRAPWGGFVDCIMVEPQLKTEGIFSSTGKIRIWMTDDARHIPIKMTAKIKIGHIVAILDDYVNIREEARGASL